MFDNLTRRFEDVFGRLRGKGRVSAADLDQATTQIRHALLEADVNLSVVDSFIERIRTRCEGSEVSASLTPGQQVIKVVNEELQTTLGAEPLTINYATVAPTVVLLAGLQGAGKTTAAAKLAQWFKSQGRNPLLVGADLQRPAAIEQLRVLAARIEVPVFSTTEAGTTSTTAAGPTETSAAETSTADPVAIAAAGLAEARQSGKDVLIVDTAGRLAVDTELMTEVAHISDAVSPHYTFLVVDAMTGQDAVNTASAFHATLEIDAVVLTKVDGDARGGAALSVSEVLGRPIAFASVGEAIDEFELFHPDRMATRILGMGDVTTLIEKAEQVYEAEEAEAAAQRLMDGSFTLDDFVDQLRQVRKMGNLKGLVAMMPGVPSEVRDADLDDGRLSTAEAIVLSMTPSERSSPDIINTARRARIAAGSGTSASQVSNLLKQFSQMKKMMTSMGGLGGGIGGIGGGGKKRAKAARKSAKGSAKGRQAAKSRQATKSRQSASGSSGDASRSSSNGASRGSSNGSSRTASRVANNGNNKGNRSGKGNNGDRTADQALADSLSKSLADLDIQLPDDLQHR